MSEKLLFFGSTQMDNFSQIVLLLSQLSTLRSKMFLFKIPLLNYIFGILQDKKSIVQSYQPILKVVME